MEATLNIFSNKEFGDIRIIMINDEPWFVGKDVATALGYSNPSKAICVHVDEDDKRFVMLDIADSQNGNVPRGKTKTAVINESGLYALIFGSKLESAKKFKHWVTSEVLPTIRKTGSYTMHQQTQYQSTESHIVGSNTAIPELGNWYSFMKLKIDTVCHAYSINRKNLYHLILTRVQGKFSWDYAVGAYIKETGHAPQYSMDVVAHFQQLQDEANYVIDALLTNAGYEV